MSILRLSLAARPWCSLHARNFSCGRSVSETHKDRGIERLSSCPANTVLGGLAYLKDQPPVLALPDDQYPAWLWDLLKPMVLPDDGPGGKTEKVRLRKEHKQKLKEQNFMKTQ